MQVFKASKQALLTQQSLPGSAKRTISLILALCRIKIIASWLKLFTSFKEQSSISGIRPKVFRTPIFKEDTFF